MISLSKPINIDRNKQEPDKKNADQFILALSGLLFFAAMAYMSIAFFWAKFSRAEVFFAECAREMIETHNFITPLYHQHAFFDKPIFVYWLIIGMFKSLGINHFAARVPSIIASLSTLASTAVAGKYLYKDSEHGPSNARGLISFCTLGSAFMYLSFSTICMSDIFLVLFDTLTLIFVYAGIKLSAKRSLLWWVASLSMGFAFLTKGPVGVVLPAAAAIVYLALTSQLGLIKIKHILLALITIAIIGSPWFYAAYLANGSSALIYFFVHENVQRFAGSAYDARKPFGYMVTGFFMGFAPWSILLPPALVAFGKGLSNAFKSSGNQNLWAKFSALSAKLAIELFLWLWVFVAVGFFCFSRGQCDYYSLPAYPAAALLAANYLNDRFGDSLVGGNSVKNLPWFIAVVAFVYAVMTVTAGVLATQAVLGGSNNAVFDFNIPQFAIVSIAYFLLLLTGAIIFFTVKQNYTSAIITASCGIFAITVFFASAVLPLLNRLEPVDNIAKLIKQQPANISVGTDIKLSAWNDEILFQSGKDPQSLDSLEKMQKFCLQTKPALIIVPMDQYKKLSLDKKSWRILAGYKVATHSLTPGYIFSRKGHIVDPVPLIVATNNETQTYTGQSTIP